MVLYNIVDIVLVNEWLDDMPFNVVSAYENYRAESGQFLKYCTMFNTELPNTMRGYRRLSLAALAGLPTD